MLKIYSFLFWKVAVSHAQQIKSCGVNLLHLLLKCQKINSMQFVACLNSPSDSSLRLHASLENVPNYVNVHQHAQSAFPISTGVKITTRPYECRSARRSLWSAATPWWRREGSGSEEGCTPGGSLKVHSWSMHSFSCFSIKAAMSNFNKKNIWEKIDLLPHRLLS